MNCKQCGQPFTSDKFNQKFCRAACRLAWWGDKVRAQYAPTVKPKKTCDHCRAEFDAVPRQRFCSLKCRKESYQSAKVGKPLVTHVKSYVSRAVYRPRGFYVYGWCNPESNGLPFYIGRGNDDRAWIRHKVGSEDAACEKLRRSDTKVVIYRDNLTNDGAALIESVLISVFYSLGCPLVNEMPALKGNPTSPLTYETVA